MNHTSILYNVDVEAAPSSKNKKGEMVACFICGNEVKILNINRMFYYLKNLIKRDLTTYEKNLIYKDFINNFISIK